jgi:hypothetical protein
MLASGFRTTGPNKKSHEGVNVLHNSQVDILTLRSHLETSPALTPSFGQFIF